MRSRRGTLLIGAGKRGRLHIETVLTHNSGALRPVFLYDHRPVPSEYPFNHPDTVSITRSQLAATAASASLAIIATPLDTHFEYLMLTLGSGCQTLVEKPAVSNQHELDEAERIAHGTLTNFFVGYSERSNPNTLEHRRSIIDAFQSAAVEEVEFLRVRPHPPVYYPVDVGEELAVHDLDLVVNDVSPHDDMHFISMRSLDEVHFVGKTRSEVTVRIAARWQEETEITSATVRFKDHTSKTYQLRSGGHHGRLASLHAQLDRILAEPAGTLHDIARERRVLGVLHG